MVAALALLATSVLSLATAGPALADGLRTGMTWTVYEQSGGYVHVGADGQSNPYTGDTTVDQYQPALCVLVDGRGAPGGFSFDFYNGWAQGAVKTTAPVRGDALSTLAQADGLCAATFGAGWRLAEFHDGRYGDYFEYSGGWSFWAAGTLTPGTRFWAGIYDQPANPWNSAGTLPPPVSLPANDLIVKTRLQELMQPLLTFANNSQFRAIVTTGVGQQFDGDDNVLLSTVISQAEAAGVVNNGTPGWTAFKDSVAAFANINGVAYQPQLAIPNYSDGAVATSTIVAAVYETDLGHTSLPAYELDGAGNLSLRSTPVDEAYAELYQVWVFSTHEDIASGQALAAASSSTSSTPSNAGQLVAATRSGGRRPAPDGTVTTNGLACNPTGLRNNNGDEYLQWFQVPDPSAVEHWTAGKLEPRVFIVGKGGLVLSNKYWGKKKRKEVKNGLYVDLRITSWDRVALGDYWAYKWIEEDNGPTITASIGLSFTTKQKLGITGEVSATFESKNDDMGEGVVAFTDSIYLLYQTGVVNWRVCSVGGDGGTGNDNLALAALAAASSTYSGYSPARVNDGSRDTRVGGAYSWANGYGTWPPGVPEWVQLDFGTNKTFSRVVVYTSQGYEIRDFDIQVWNGTTWVTVSTVVGNTATSVTLTFAPQTSRLVRVLGHSGPTSQPGYVRVNEFEVYA
ncbi:MAG TPA: discoidin domain-containing protein [Micromonosporaceae bacterium]